MTKTIKIANHVHTLALVGFTEEEVNEVALLNDNFGTLDEFVEEYSVLGDDIVTRLKAHPEETNDTKEDTMSEDTKTETKEETKEETITKTPAVRLTQQGLPVILLSKETLEGTGLKGDASLVKDEVYEMDYFTFATKASKVLRDMVTDELGHRIEASIKRMQAKAKAKEAPKVQEPSKVKEAVVKPTHSKEEAIRHLVDRLASNQEGPVAPQVVVDLLQAPVRVGTLKVPAIYIEGKTLFIHIERTQYLTDKRWARLISAVKKAIIQTPLVSLAIKDDRLPIIARR